MWLTFELIDLFVYCYQVCGLRCVTDIALTRYLVPVAPLAYVMQRLDDVLAWAPRKARDHASHQPEQHLAILPQLMRWPLRVADVVRRSGGVERHIDVWPGWRRRGGSVGGGAGTGSVVVGTTTSLMV